MSKPEEEMLTLSLSLSIAGIGGLSIKAEIKRPRILTSSLLDWRAGKKVSKIKRRVQ